MEFFFFDKVLGLFFFSKKNFIEKLLVETGKNINERLFNMTEFCYNRIKDKKNFIFA